MKDDVSDEDSTNCNISRGGSGGWSPIKFLDDNVRYIQYPFYAAGLLGIVIIARSIRLTSKFSHVTDIPKEFFVKNVKLYGKAVGLEKPVGNADPLIILVDHKPILEFKRVKNYVKFFNKNSSLQKTGKHRDLNLRILVPGVGPKGKFFPIVESKVVGQQISFKLIETDEKTASAIVAVRTIKFKIFPYYENLGFWCTQNGFSSVVALKPEILKCEILKLYYKKLLKVEQQAVRKRRGVWEEASKTNANKNKPSISSKWMEIFRKLYEWIRKS